MSEFNNNGNINAGRDNVINVGEKKVFKSFYQLVPHELRNEDDHSRKVSWNHRKGLIKKSKIPLIILFVGLIGLGFAFFFVRELILDYSGGAYPNIKVIVRFIWDSIGAVQDQRVFFGYFALLIISFAVFLILPVIAIGNLWFKEDDFLREQREYRRMIRNRLLGLGETP